MYIFMLIFYLKTTTKLEETLPKITTGHYRNQNNFKKTYQSNE